eukprot:SAG31_NODE_2390_length_5804_cov_2.122699_2_plen_184_part_00
MHAAMAAASRLGKADGLEMHEAAALAQESLAVSTAITELGDDAEKRSRLHTHSADIERMVTKFWTMLQMESQRMHDGQAKLTPGVADALNAGAEGQSREQLRPGVVTRAAYTEFHMRVNKTITASQSWTVDGALTDAQQDWQDDVSRFAESATVVEWLKKVQHQFQKTAARYVSEHGWTALFK